jgi:hypothetical protein
MSSAITAPPHHWLTKAVLVQPTLLITGRRDFWEVESDARTTEVSA